MLLSSAPILVMLMVAPLAAPAHRWRSSNDDLSQIYDSATPNPTGSLSGPWFDMDEGDGEITGVKDKTSHLACRVKNLGNQTLSWLRHRDTHLLTMGLYTFTPDTRFHAIHRPNSENWVLEISPTRVSDQGTYECQVSTTPVRSHILRLTVAEPKISLHGGGPDRHIKHGSFINISCEIEGYPKPVGYVMWYKDDKLIQPGKRFNISLDQNGTDRGLLKTVSSLLVASALATDTGSYRCASEAGESPTVNIHVITGETRAGLQVNSSPDKMSSSPLLLFCCYSFRRFPSSLLQLLLVLALVTH